MLRKKVELKTNGIQSYLSEEKSNKNKDKSNEIIFALSKYKLFKKLLMLALTIFPFKSFATINRTRKCHRSYSTHAKSF